MYNYKFVLARWSRLGWEATLQGPRRSPDMNAPRGNLTTPNGEKESSGAISAKTSFTILFSERGSGNRRNLQLLIGILNIYNNKGAVSKRGALKDKVTFLKQFPPNLNINNLKYSRWPSPRLPNS